MELEACPRCGARNPADAAWCGQCYLRLDGADDTSDAEPAVAAGPDRPEEIPRDDPASDVATWTCATCGEPVPIDVDRCPICGTSLVEAFAPARSRPGPAETLVASVLPGYGLVRVGLVGQGTILGMLSLFGLLGGLALVAVGRTVGWVMVGTGVGVAGLAARDALAEADGRTAWTRRPAAVSLVAVVVVGLAAVTIAIAAIGARTP